MIGEYFTLHFDDRGNFFFPEEQEVIIDSLLNLDAPVTDLWIFSHGWRTDEEQADALYHNWIHLLQEQINKNTTSSIYRPLFVGIYWPSIGWISDIKKTAPAPPLSPLKGISFPVDSGEFEMEIEEAMEDPKETANISEKVQFEIGKSADPNQSAISGLTSKVNFMNAYRNMVDISNQKELDYEQDFASLYDILVAPSHSTVQIETFLEILYRYKIDDPHSEVTENNNITQSPENALAYLQDNLNTTTTEILRPDNILFQFFQSFTFWTMKARAAVVGQNGTAPFLGAIKEELSRHQRDVHIHLLGHSFGAKLLSAAVYGLADIPHFQAPLIDSLILLLGAFSQFSFSSQIPPDPGNAGRYASIIEQRLVAHPITVIYSRHDLANNRCYPLGMLVDRSHSTYERGGPDDRLGSIGANGAQGLGTILSQGIDLLPLETSYDTKLSGNIACLNVDAQYIINTYADRFFVGAHGDIYHPEIFHLALAVSRHQ